jgi:integrase
MIYKRGKCKVGEDARCKRCGRRGSCGVYWYKFMWHGRLVRESTKQGNDKVARQMESAHRTSLAKGEVGIRDKKPTPTLKEFIVNRVEPWAQMTFQKSSPGTFLRWYRPGFRAICAYPQLATLSMDHVSGENIASFAAHRHAQGRQVSSVNSTLRVLRRVLGLAVEWGLLAGVPRMKLLGGERHRDRVVSRDEEMQYLTFAPEPLASIAAVMLDTGLRPDECASLRWEYVAFSGTGGTLQVSNGKTPSARRLLPMSARVRSVLASLWNTAGKPETGHVWKGQTKTGYVASETIRRMHLRTLDSSKVRHFVLHGLRHTFLTRLGAAGVDAWTLARIAGHSSIKMSMRYVHPDEAGVVEAIARLGGHNNRHTEIGTLHDDENKLATANIS